MSDLNQAIREHLALKRLHGADPGEVARLEREVFGEQATQMAADVATAYPPQDHGAFDRLAPIDPVEEPRFREELVAPTNQYARTSLRPYMDAAEETQEYTVEDRVGWSIGPAWHGGAA
jgi:hypothetical protein